MLKHLPNKIPNQKKQNNPLGQVPYEAQISLEALKKDIKSALMENLLSPQKKTLENILKAAGENKVCVL